jgi:hypothetical protein
VASSLSAIGRKAACASRYLYLTEICPSQIVMMERVIRGFLVAPACRCDVRFGSNADMCSAQADVR